MDKRLAIEGEIAWIEHERCLEDKHRDKRLAELREKLKELPTTTVTEPVVAEHNKQRGIV